MRYFARWLVVVTFLPLGACGSTTTSTGRFVSDATVAQLSAGMTDADWLHLLLGAPDEQRSRSDGGKTWVWNNRKTRREHRLGAETESIERTTFVDLTSDSRIEHAWIEEDRSAGWSD